MRAIGVIPARYKSTRFPGKPLVELLGKPMILWVAELSARALGKENVYVATEDNRIKEVVVAAGFQAVMTSDAHLTGTDRLAEVAEKIEADIYINIQGDEPVVDPGVINTVLEEKKKHPDAIVNAMAKVASDEDPHSVNIPKVIFNEAGQMIYMSRLAVPGFKSDDNKPTDYYKQVCVYAFTREQLIKFGAFGRKGTLEQHEDIEILRYLELGVPIRMLEVEGGSWAVDVASDVQVVEQKLNEIHDIK